MRALILITLAAGTLMAQDPVSDMYDVQFYTKIENVFDDDYLQNGYLTPGTWAVGGLRFKY